MTQAPRVQLDQERPLAEALAGVGVAGEDLVIGLDENTPAGWSFGLGRAQCTTGELATPGA